MATTEQIIKLPRWAQQELNIRQQTIDTLTRELAQYQGVTGSQVFRRAPTGLSWTPLPEGTIRFTWSPSRLVDVRINGEHLDVNAQPGVKIQPKAANHILLIPEL